MKMTIQQRLDRIEDALFGDKKKKTEHNMLAMGPAECPACSAPKYVDFYKDQTSYWFKRWQKSERLIMGLSEACALDKDDLKATIKQLKAAAVVQQSAVEGLIDDKAALTDALAQVSRRLDSLKPYLRHYEDCWVHYAEGRSCTCGLDGKRWPR